MPASTALQSIWYELFQLLRKPLLTEEEEQRKAQLENQMDNLDPDGIDMLDHLREIDK